MVLGPLLPEVRGRFKPVSQQTPLTPQYTLSCDAPSVVTSVSPDQVGGGGLMEAVL